MELAGRRLNNGSNWNWGSQRKGSWGSNLNWSQGRGRGKGKGLGRGKGRLGKDRLRSWGRNKGNLPLGKHLVNRKEVGSGDGSSKRSWGREGLDHMVKDRGRSIVNNGDRKLKDRGKGKLIISINRLSFSLLHTVCLGFSMSSKVVSSSSSHLRGF